MKAILFFALLVTISVAHHDDPIDGTWNGSQLVSYTIADQCADAVATCNFTCTFESSAVNCYRPVCTFQKNFKLIFKGHAGNYTLSTLAIIGTYVQNDDHTIDIETSSGEAVCMHYSLSGKDLSYSFDTVTPDACPSTLEANCVDAGGNITSQIIAGVLTNPNFSAAETLQMSSLFVILVALYALFL